jgi:hypothetical protein
MSRGVVAAAVLLAVAFLALSCGATFRELESQAGASQSASSTPVPTASASAAPNCDALARVTPVPAPGLVTTDLGNGTQSVASAEAGYSIVVPASWSVSPGILTSTSPSFGQAHMSSFDRQNFDPASVRASGRMLSPDVGIRLDIELWRNPKVEGAEQYARNVHIGPDQSAVLPGRVVTIAGQRAYHTTIQDEHRFQPASGPLEVTRQTRLLWLVPVARPDRMLVIYATPGESGLRSQAEAAVATLQQSQPVVTHLPVVHQRDAVLRQWLHDKNGGRIAGRRAEAKLISYTDAAAAMNSGSLLRIDRDPDELFWLVAVSGPDLPHGRLGPLQPQTSPAPVTWIQFSAPATNGRYEGTAMQYATTGNWPPGFDALFDRCR